MMNLSDLLRVGTVNNAELIYDWCKYLMKCKVTTAVTGNMNTDKSVFMETLVEGINPRMTLMVVSEESLNRLRIVYPERNVIKITKSVIDPDILDRIISPVYFAGELTCDIDVMRLIQVTQAGLELTLFEYPSDTAENLISFLSKSVLQSDGFSSLDISKQQVSNVVQMDIHLGITKDGSRIVKRVTEICQESNGEITTRDIIVYDIDADTYNVGVVPSIKLLQNMHESLSDEEKYKFDEFVSQSWVQPTEEDSLHEEPKLKVFIGGIRGDVHSLPPKIMDMLSKFAENKWDILVGDCPGVDAIIQKVYAEKNYRNVTVYASEGKARNNVGNFPIKAIQVGSSVKNFNYYSAKDKAMAEDADKGFMIWDTHSKGTGNNIRRLLECGKSVWVYIIQKDQLYELKTLKDLCSLS